MRQIRKRRRVINSGRIVHTIEERGRFYVFHASRGYANSVSGPFFCNDKRFSRPL